MKQEKELSPQLMPLLDAQRARAAASLDELERKYEELRLAIFFQDFSNFFHLAHNCHEIADLHTRSISDNFPTRRTRVRIGLAIQRYAFLAQSMRDINTAKLTPEEKELKLDVSDDLLNLMLSMPLEIYRPTKPRTPENFRALMLELAAVAD